MGIDDEDYNSCTATHDHGWGCTRRIEHDGPHIAVADDWDDVCAVWSDEVDFWGYHDEEKN